MVFLRMYYSYESRWTSNKKVSNRCNFQISVCDLIAKNWSKNLKMVPLTLRFPPIPIQVSVLKTSSPIHPIQENCYLFLNFKKGQNRPWMKPGTFSHSHPQTSWTYVSGSAAPVHPSAFPRPQPKWQAYEQMREYQPHNRRFATLFYKALVTMTSESYRA